MTYYLILGIVSSVIALIAAAAIFFIVGLTTDWEVNKKTNILAFTLLFLFSSLIAPISFYSLHRLFDLNPSILTKNIDSVQESDNLSAELSKIDDKAIMLRDALDEPKKLTIEQIETILSETLNFSEEMKSILTKQKGVIDTLKHEVVFQKRRAEESQKLAQEIQSLTKKQLNAVKLLITEDAKESSKGSFYKGIILSFPIGVLASLLATLVFRRYGVKIRDEYERTQ